MLTASPIDFAATRKAIVAALAQATGLPATQVIRRQAAGPVQPPPPRPYASFNYRMVGMRAGEDWVQPAFDVGPTTYRYGGERGLAVDFNFHADDQDTAYGLCLIWQAALSQQPIRELLEAGGMTVWTIGDAQDLTALLSTGYEARAYLECELWVGIETLVDLGSIDAVAIQGAVYFEDGRTALTVSTAVEAKG